MKEGHAWSGYLPRKPLDAAQLERLNAYFSKAQPTWRVLPEQGVLRAVIDGYPDLMTGHFVLRQSIDLDLHEFKMPEALERQMLLLIIRSYRAALADVLKNGVPT